MVVVSFPVWGMEAGKDTTVSATPAGAGVGVADLGYRVSVAVRVNGTAAPSQSWVST